jgi:hypothetical protein
MTMIVARVDNKLLVVLEPGNIAKMQAGKPVHLELKDYFLEVSIDVSIAYTPDMAWIMAEMKKGRPLLAVLEESLLRPERIIRPYHEAEKLKNVKL